MADDMKGQDVELEPWRYGLNAQETAGVFGAKDNGLGKDQTVKRLDIQIPLNTVIDAFPEIDFNGKAGTAAKVRLPGWNNVERGTFDVTMSVVLTRDKDGNLLSRESRYYQIEDAPEKESMSIPSLSVSEKFKDGQRVEMTINDGPEGYDRRTQYEFYQERFKRGLTAREIRPTRPKDTPRDFCTYHYDDTGALSRTNGPAVEGRIKGADVARYMLQGAEMSRDAYERHPGVQRDSGFGSSIRNLFGLFAARREAVEPSPQAAAAAPMNAAPARKPGA